jgi:hypothetical protein
MKKSVLIPLAVVAVVAGSLAFASPASAKNKCGAVYFERTGVSSARLVQTCDQGTQVVYSVRCLLPGGNQQYTRYFSQSQSAVTDVRCSGNNPIVSASYSLA